MRPQVFEIVMGTNPENALKNSVTSLWRHYDVIKTSKFKSEITVEP